MPTRHTLELAAKRPTLSADLTCSSGTVCTLAHGGLLSFRNTCSLSVQTTKHNQHRDVFLPPTNNPGLLFHSVWSQLVSLEHTRACVRQHHSCPHLLCLKPFSVSLGQQRKRIAGRMRGWNDKSWGKSACLRKCQQLRSNQPRQWRNPNEFIWFSSC